MKQTTNEKIAYYYGVIFYPLQIVLLLLYIIEIITQSYPISIGLFQLSVILMLYFLFFETIKFHNGVQKCLKVIKK